MDHHRWIITGGGGLYLLSIWLIEYDKDFHSVMAMRWLGVYRAARAAARARRSVPHLTLVGGKGWGSGDGRVGVLASSLDLGPPERNFPLPVVIAHGAFAAVTITLVLLTALGVGGG